MDELRLPASLERSRRVLVAGAGGGFDVYAGLPIYERLRRLGKQVFLANLTFTNLGRSFKDLFNRLLGRWHRRRRGRCYPGTESDAESNGERAQRTPQKTPDA